MKIEPLKKEWFEIAQKRLDSLTKPRGSLGRLEEFAAKLVAIFENEIPAINKKAVFVFAGDHGIVEEGVSAFPKEVTSQMVYNFLRGTAGINVFAKHVKDADPEIRPGSEVIIVDEEDNLLAVGKAILNGKEMIAFKSGIAVKVRRGVGE